MYRLKEDHMEELEIKRSRFLCYLHRCTQEAEAKAFIQSIKKEHPNASHCCYAFILGYHKEIQRSNDDGEPSGTAGVPMLECLHKQNMQDIVAVTVRYFGGIKLGAGGLLRAYAKSVSHALQHAILTQTQTMLEYQLCFPYEMLGKIDYFLHNEHIDILDKDYEESITYICLCKETIEAAISEITNGSCHAEFLKTRDIDVVWTSTHTN